MRLNLFSKLFMAMLLATVLVAAVMVAFVNWSFRTGFEDYHHAGELILARQLAGSLEKAYAREGNWDFIRHNPRRWEHQLEALGERSAGRPPPRPPPFWAGPGGPPPFPPPPRAAPPPPVGNGPFAARPLGDRLNLLDADGNPVIGPPENLNLPPNGASRIRKLEIMADGKQVGWVTLRQGKLPTNQLAQTFLDQQMRNLYLIGLFAAGLSFLLAGLLVRHFLRPVRSLTSGAQALTAGDFSTRIRVDTQDELGTLAGNFNKLAETLQRNETLRQQWLADISHELRTPIAVLRSEIEAMLDGVRKPALERIRSLHVDVLSLGKLVEDLYQLSLSDSQETELPNETADLAEMLEDAATAAETRLREKHIRLHMQFDATKPLLIRGDSTRLFQLFSNLLANSHRYTDEGGQVEILAKQQDGKIQVIVRDSAPGVPDETLPLLFERLFRVDKSRSRALGGSGLGLSISKNIVQAHGGDIRAKHSPLGGLAICMEFPLMNTQKNS